MPSPAVPRVRKQGLAFFVLAIGILCAAAVAMIQFRGWHTHGSSSATPPTLRQLTSSAAENFVEYACISPDGKYVAYLEKAGNLYMT